MTNHFHLLIWPGNGQSINRLRRSGDRSHGLGEVNPLPDPLPAGPNPGSTETDSFPDIVNFRGGTRRSRIAVRAREADRAIDIEAALRKRSRSRPTGFCANEPNPGRAL